MALEERLLALRPEGDVDRDPGMGQAQLEHRHVGALAADDHVGEAEVDLGLLARVVDGDDRDVPPVEVELAAKPRDGPPDRRLGDRCALLVDQALPDPARGVALLAMDRPVLGQPARDGRVMGPAGRPDPLDHLARRRDGRGEGLPHRAAVHPVAARQLADRHPFLPMVPADTLELLHPRQLLPPSLDGLARPAERRDRWGRGWGQF